MNFHVLCAILLRHGGRFNIFLPAAELMRKTKSEDERTLLLNIPCAVRPTQG